ncbi:MAG: hypothetical protein U0229_13150 [Anaeromyxobacter sp.]
MAGAPPVQLTLFVPGTARGQAGWRDALASTGLRYEGDRLSGADLPFEVDVEWIENDGSFGRAFSFGTATAAEQRAIDGAGSAVVLTVPTDLRTGRAAVEKLAHKLQHAGALAVRLEQSKLGYPVAKWLELAGSVAWGDLYRMAVVVLSDESRTTSVGMHAFGLPDARVEHDEGLDAAGANELVGIFNVFQLAEEPTLGTGHTFSPDDASARRALERWPDDGYESGHPCHNPFGVWRLGGPGVKPRRLPESLRLVLVPALVVLLGAEERKAGRPLTREEVERITTEAACIAMKPADAQAMERSRGYADLEPELAWEQWQIARKWFP